MNLAEYRKMANIEGALPNAIFNVSPTKKVVFSKGNLQFREDRLGVKTIDGRYCLGRWRFSEHQCDVISGKGYGDFRSKLSDEDWVDSFGWGTSGWRDGVTACYPWSVSRFWGNYFLNKESAVGKYAYADWGVYNPISNGGNLPNLWRTPTAEEWCYLLNHARWTFACVNKIDCLLLLPQKFTAPDRASVVEINGTFPFERNSKECPYNDYDVQQFSALEDLGVVALPMHGKGGIYWTSSCDTFPNALLFGYDVDNNLIVDMSEFPGSMRNAVRLVHDL